jgi:hypothetical protein
MAKSTNRGKSVAGRFKLVVFGSCDVPPFPGQTNICFTRGDCDNFHARACSLPPLPSSRMRVVIVEKLKVTGLDLDPPALGALDDDRDLTTFLH